MEKANTLDIPVKSADDLIIKRDIQITNRKCYLDSFLALDFKKRDLECFVKRDKEK